jgi:hypothetical protein
MCEAAARPTGPRGDALFDILRQVSQIVPKLHDSSGRALLVPIIDWKLTYRVLDQPSDEFRALSVVLRTICHICTTRYGYRNKDFSPSIKCLLYAYGCAMAKGALPCKSVIGED